MPTGLIEIQDEVNVRFLGVPKPLIKLAQEELTYWVPGYKFMPAYRGNLGNWDGKIRLMSNTGKTYLSLVDRVLPVFEKAGYDFVIDDMRHDWSDVIDQIELPDEHMFSEHTWPDGKPIILRDYQLDAVHSAINNGSGLLELATGAGKTLVCAAISKVYEEYGKVIVIVPNIDLAIQTQGLFKRVGIDTGIWYGEMKDDKNVLISTWQSLDHYHELMAGVVCTIVDEAHQAKAKTLSALLGGPASNVPFRFGCTGTVPKEDLNRNQICGVIGEVIFRLKAHHLQDRGVLASAEVLQVELMDSRNQKYLYSNEFDDWNEQLNWMFADPDRLGIMVDIINDSAQSNGNTLVLIPHKKHGKALEKSIPNSVSVDGDMKAKKRREKYDWFDASDNAVLIATYGVASTGLDIPRIKVLTFIEPGKKFEKVIQTVGRGLRKAHDKDHIYILDIISDVQFSAKHAAERRKLYKEAKLDCDVEKLDYVNLG